MAVLEVKVHKNGEYEDTRIVDTEQPWPKEPGVFLQSLDRKLYRDPRIYTVGYTWKFEVAKGPSYLCEVLSAKPPFFRLGKKYDALNGKVVEIAYFELDPGFYNVLIGGTPYLGQTDDQVLKYLIDGTEMISDILTVVEHFKFRD